MGDGIGRSATRSPGELPFLQVGHALDGNVEVNAAPQRLHVLSKEDLAHSAAFDGENAISPGEVITNPKRRGTGERFLRQRPGPGAHVRDG